MLLFPPDQARTVEQLRQIPVPETRGWGAGGGGTWKPVGHGALADTVLGEIARAGLRPASARWAVNDSETDLFGAVVFEPRRGLRLPKGTALALALRHSNAGRYALTFGFGAQVFVCSNGMLAAQHTVARKHTKRVRLEEPIREGLGRLLDDTQRISDFVAELRGTRVSQRLADRVLVEAGRRKLLPWSKLGKVEALWRDNPQRAFRARNAWSLYNCFTEVAKQRGAARQLETLEGLSGLFEGRALRRLGR